MGKKLTDTLRERYVTTWCDGSSDRSFMVDPFQPVFHDWCNKIMWNVLSCLWDAAY